jgi:hypothetical protein
MTLVVVVVVGRDPPPRSSIPRLTHAAQGQLFNRSCIRKKYMLWDSVRIPVYRLIMTSLPIFYQPPPNASLNLQHVFKFRISDTPPTFPELADFQRVHEEKELIEAENEARERKKMAKPPSKKISDFAQQMKEEKEPLNHYDREAIFSAEQSALNQEYLCSVTSNAHRVDEVDPTVYRKPKPEPLFVQFVAIVRSDRVELTPVSGNLYEAKRRPSTTGRRNLDRRQHDGEREKKDANEMLRLLGAHRKLEAHDKDLNKYMAVGGGDDTAENNTDDIHRRIDIDSNDLDMDVVEGMDGAGFEDPNAETAEEQKKNEERAEGVNLDAEGQLDKYHADEMEAMEALNGIAAKAAKKKNRSELPGTIETKLRAGSLSVAEAKKWISQLMEEFDVNKEQLMDQLKDLTEYRGSDASKELILKQKAPATGGVAKKQRK